MHIYIYMLLMLGISSWKREKRFLIGFIVANLSQTDKDVFISNQDQTSKILLSKGFFFVTTPRPCANDSLQRTKHCQLVRINLDIFERSRLVTMESLVQTLVVIDSAAPLDLLLTLFQFACCSPTAYISRLHTKKKKNSVLLFFRELTRIFVISLSFNFWGKINLSLKFCFDCLSSKNFSL